MQSIIKAAAIIFTSLALLGCSKKNPVKSTYSVTATTFPCYDAVRSVCGELSSEISLKLLVKPGTEVHSFDPTPQDIISIQKSNLFVYVGGESDEWVEKLIETSKDEFKAAELKLIDCVETLGEFDNPHEEDEHIWTSPKNEILIVQAVCDSLCKIAPKHAESFKNNSEKYVDQIKLVAAKTLAVVSNAQNKTIVVADRFPLSYFADYYGLSFDAAFSGCSTAVEASTATIARLIKTVNEDQLPAVFYIELGNHKLADNIAESCGVQALLLQSVQNLTKDDFNNGETWVSLMNRNADTLAIGLK